MEGANQGISKQFDVLNTDDFKIAGMSNPAGQQVPEGQAEEPANNINFASAPQGQNQIEIEHEDIDADLEAEQLKPQGKKKKRPKSKEAAESTMYSRALLDGQLPDPADAYDDEEEDDDEPDSPTILDNFLNPHSPSMPAYKGDHKSERDSPEEMKHQETEAEDEEVKQEPPTENQENRAFRAQRQITKRHLSQQVLPDSHRQQTFVNPDKELREQEQAQKIDDILAQITSLSPKKIPQIELESADEMMAKQQELRQLRTEMPDNIRKNDTLHNPQAGKKQKNLSERGSRHSFLEELESRNEDVIIDHLKDNEESKMQKTKKLSKILVDAYLVNQMSKINEQRERIRRQMVNGEQDESYSLGSAEKDRTVQDDEEEEKNTGRSQSSRIKNTIKVSTVNAKDDSGDEMPIYPPGFTADDDLDGDGQIDVLESQIKVEIRKQEIQDHIDKQIQKEYHSKFRKEVDFHHKIAYKFERAYKLGKKNPEKQQDLDMEIIDLLSDYSDYVQHDPLVLFYCLFFCIYYNNAFLVEFLRTLISKINVMNPGIRNKFDLLLDFIDVNGLERTRTVGESINTRVYHIVFYQSVQDKLRVVYSKILKKLTQIQIRNEDATLLLNTRDYDMIMVCFQKLSTKVNVNILFEVQNQICHSYKRYNPAFFEEVLLDPDSKIEKRVAQNYRERFLVQKEAIYQVLLMYSKKDYMDYFLDMKDEAINALSKQQLIDLFVTCLKSDSFKLGLQLYCRFLRPSDMTADILARIMLSIRDSVKFMEIKLFFLHEHFDVLDVEAMNQLLDILLMVLRRSTYHSNPIINAYNTVKVTLLVYKITFRIEQMNIYALITKCQLINKYVEDSLNSYLHLQSNIGQLSLFMLEPVLDLKRQQDSLDIMLEMKMERILNHPVIIEVLNLVYEGKYSINSSLLYLSQTFASFFNSETFEMKSVLDRLFQNIQTFTSDSQIDQKQSSLQYNIWKYCIQQRLLDETFFIIVNCLLLFFQGYRIQDTISEEAQFQEYIFDQQFTEEPELFAKQDPNKIAMFCPRGLELVAQFQDRLGLLQVQIIFITIAFGTSVLQKLAIIKLKSNAQLDPIMFISELICTALGITFLVKAAQSVEDGYIVDPCLSLVSMTSSEATSLRESFFLMRNTDPFNLLQVFSLAMIAFVVHMILTLKRTDQFGYLVIMIQQMIAELGKYFTTFGLVLFFFFAGLRIMTLYYKNRHLGIYETFIDTINLFVGVTDLSEFTYSQGQIYMLVCSFLSKTFLFSFMIAMFVLRYFFVWQNIEATRRMDIIKLKNTQQFDPMYGCITMSYFPINVILLPFMIPIILIKSDRLNQSVLQLQYFLLVIAYLCMAVIVAIPLLPLLYFKMVINQAYVLSQARTDKKGKFIKAFWAIFAVFFGPLVVLVSMLVDILNLNGLLMQDEKHFEFKYQKFQALEPQVLFPVTAAFYRVFIVQFEKVYKNKGKTEFQLMFQHRRIFSIQDNFHSVFCKGDKTYEDSIHDIKMYNLTKVLGGQASIPSKMGEKKLDYLNYDVMAAIFEDIVMYNYFEYTLINFKAGADLVPLKAMINKYAYPYKEYDRRQHDWCLTTMTRDYSDLFNFFAINAVTKAFTDVLEIAKTYQMETNFMQEKKQVIQLDRMREEWNLRLTSTVDDLVWKMSDMVSEMREADMNQKRVMQLQELKKKRQSMASSMMSQIHDTFTAKIMGPN